MATDYIRPKDVQEAIRLLKKPNHIPLAGGTLINTPEFKARLRAQPGEDKVTFVDLQDLGFTQIKKQGNQLEIGASATLEDLCTNAHVDTNLKKAIALEAPLNIRNAATVAGTLVVCDGRSPFSTAMLALDAKMVFEPGEKEILIGNYLPLRNDRPPGKLVTKVFIPLNVTLSFEHVARTKFDIPIVCIAVAKWASGRTRLALGGYGATPLLALDGTSSDDLITAARNGFHEASDEWASAEYRSDAAATLVGRCLG